MLGLWFLPMTLFYRDSWTRHPRLCHMSTWHVTKGVAECDILWRGRMDVKNIDENMWDNLWTLILIVKSLYLILEFPVSNLLKPCKIFIISNVYFLLYLSDHFFFNSFDIRDSSFNVPFVSIFSNFLKISYHSGTSKVWF